mmetsp:Transcript_72298/g.205263  ORF Transcript_72298/g.205263 Transcript_72298/m.205263 type:complete len:297 (+) Transcript_72298:683-1573(+)
MLLDSSHICAKLLEDLLREGTVVVAVAHVPSRVRQMPHHTREARGDRVHGVDRLENGATGCALGDLLQIRHIFRRNTKSVEGRLEVGRAGVHGPLCLPGVGPHLLDKWPRVLTDPEAHEAPVLQPPHWGVDRPRKHLGHARVHLEVPPVPQPLHHAQMLLVQSHLATTPAGQPQWLRDHLFPQLPHLGEAWPQLLEHVAGCALPVSGGPGALLQRAGDIAPGAFHPRVAAQVPAHVQHGVALLQRHPQRAQLAGSHGGDAPEAIGHMLPHGWLAGNGHILRVRCPQLLRRQRRQLV